MPFQLSQDAAVTVTIYDVQGQRIRQLQLGLVTAGRYVTAATRRPIGIGRVKWVRPKIATVRPK